MIATLALVVASWYGLHFRIDPAHHALSADADVRVKNEGSEPAAKVPLLLYRLFDVESASGPFVQKVVKFPDEPAWQVNAVEVTLPKPLPPGESATVHLKYGGPLLGYREVMQYVRDTVGDDYTLIRAETMAYPIVGTPSKESWRQTYRHKFDYEVDVAAPEGFVTVCSAKNCRGAGADSINVAIAKFRVLDDANLHVYAMQSDAEAGSRVMSEMRRALDFYQRYVGPAPAAGDLTLIEIPDGWGSYGLPGTIFQQAATFRDKSSVHELYHEVAHIWNAKAADRIQRARYFDEAFATYFEALAVREFQGADAFRDFMQDTREGFIRRAAKNPLGRTTPIADYGPHDLGDFSYNKGAWSLYVLHELLGEEAFRRAMAVFLADYAKKPADFPDFRASLETTTGRNLGKWYEQWITTAESSTALIDNKPVSEMAAAAK